VVDDLTVEDFTILAGWLDRHEQSNKRQDDEDEE
jgi:hypothetical protein